MAAGFCFVLLGLLVLLYPQILVILIAGLLMTIGLGIMMASWHFRRVRRHFDSQMMNWIFRS